MYILLPALATDRSHLSPSFLFLVRLLQTIFASLRKKYPFNVKSIQLDIHLHQTYWLEIAHFAIAGYVMSLISLIESTPSFEDIDMWSYVATKAGAALDNGTNGKTAINIRIVKRLLVAGYCIDGAARRMNNSF